MKKVWLETCSSRVLGRSTPVIFGKTHSQEQRALIHQLAHQLGFTNSSKSDAAGGRMVCVTRRAEPKRVEQKEVKEAGWWWRFVIVYYLKIINVKSGTGKTTRHLLLSWLLPYDDDSFYSMIGLMIWKDNLGPGCVMFLCSSASSNLKQEPWFVSPKPTSEVAST